MALLCSTSCVGYVTAIKIDGRSGSTLPLSEAEIESVARAIEPRIQRLGFVRHPSLDRIREDSQESKDVPDLVFYSWILDPERSGDDLAVLIVQRKSDGEVSLLIVNRTWPRPTKETDALVTAVQSELSEVVPGRALVVEEGKQGPFLAP
jgi:hypothetical protein